MFQTKLVAKIKTHLIFHDFFLSKVMPYTRQCGKIPNRKIGNILVIRLMRFACWISKATDTHSEYELLIAFPQQQWLRECTSVLRFTYIASLVIVKPGCT